MDLFRGERTPGPDTIMAEAYVLTGQRHAESSQAAFVSKYGEVFRALPFLGGTSAADTARRVYELHQRHGRSVAAVVATQTRSENVVADRLKLADNSLLAMITGPQALDIVSIDPTERELPASVQAAERPIATLSRPITLSASVEAGQVAFADGKIILRGKSALLILALLPGFLSHHRHQLGPPFTPPDKLAKDLGTSEQALRRLIGRTRKLLAKRFTEAFGAAIDDDDVIQNQPWSGYRLNPYLGYVPLLRTATSSAAAAE